MSGASLPVLELLSLRKVLFICIHNSGRSQMAEAFLNHHGAGRFEAKSAGLEPGVLNPLVVEAMQEAGIDISQNQTKSVFNIWRSGELFEYVIAVCDPEAAEKCPIFPGVAKHLHWPFEDPAKAEGTHEEKMETVSVIRDAIESRIQGWLASFAVESQA